MATRNQGGTGSNNATTGRKFVLIAAISLGILAALINWVYASSIDGAKLTVLRVKGKAIPMGTLVSDEMFEPVAIHGDLSKMRALAVDKNDFPAYRKRPVTQTMEPGELLLLRSFELTGDGGIRDSIRPGQRIISIKALDESQVVAYSIRPGDSVDVWAMIGGTAYRIKEQACVRAVGEVFNAPTEGSNRDSKYRTVTIAVDANDVKGLVSNIGVSGGAITFTLVGPCDVNAPNIPALEPVIVATPGKPSPSAEAKPPGKK